MDKAIKIRHAVEWIRSADGILITAGAGAGVDSGMPDFRGVQGLWRAYPGLAKAGLRFEEIANPKVFEENPRLAWGFYGHRLTMYRATQPHRGFAILKAWADGMLNEAFVYTSNVDGQFQKAGFAENRVLECHGSIHHLQCMRNCTERIWPAGDLRLEVNEETCMLTNSLPLCPFCGAIARPNVLMFGDGGWISTRTDHKMERLREWLCTVRRRVVVEMGAGTAIPTVRSMSVRNGEGRVIRINLDDDRIAETDGIGFRARALDTLVQLDQALRSAGKPGAP